MRRAPSTLRLQGASPKTLPQTLAGGDNTALAERVERLLRVPASMGLATRAQCLEYLGGLFRPTLGTPAHHTDMQVGPRACLLQ